MPFNEARRAWVRVAAQSFGGPAGQIAVIHRIVVEEKRWVDESTFLRALGYCMLLPGPEAQQLATYLGWKLHGVRGGLLAGGLFILPGFLSILALSVLYARYGNGPALTALFYGLKPAVLAIVLYAVWRLRRRAVADAFSVSLAAAAFLGMFVFGVPFPLVILTAALVGAARPGPHTSMGDANTGVHEGPLRLMPIMASLVLWLGVWLIPVVGLYLVAGPGHVLTQQAVFFSKTAVVTFGGAYSVLAYVAQQAVEFYGWLGPSEMLDGLGMAETTPGPLIQVVQFVGFMGAYRNPAGLDPLLAGVLASVVTTWVTFAPCFLFIFAVAPLVGELQRRPRLQAALAGVTAAVVGVILNLALWFALHTMFADVRLVTAGPFHLDVPVWRSIDIGAALTAALCVILAFRFRAGMFAVLAAGCAAGVFLTLLL